MIEKNKYDVLFSLGLLKSTNVSETHAALISELINDDNIEELLAEVKLRPNNMDVYYILFSSFIQMVKKPLLKKMANSLTNIIDVKAAISTTIEYIVTKKSRNSLRTPVLVHIFEIIFEYNIQKMFDLICVEHQYYIHFLISNYKIEPKLCTKIMDFYRLKDQISLTNFLLDEKLMKKIDLLECIVYLNNTNENKKNKKLILFLLETLRINKGEFISKNTKYLEKYKAAYLANVDDEDLAIYWLEEDISLEANINSIIIGSQCVARFNPELESLSEEPLKYVLFSQIIGNQEDENIKVFLNSGMTDFSLMPKCMENLMKDSFLKNIIACHLYSIYDISFVLELSELSTIITMCNVLGPKKVYKIFAMALEDKLKSFININPTLIKELGIQTDSIESCWFGMYLEKLEKHSNFSEFKIDFYHHVKKHKFISNLYNVLIASTEPEDQMVINIIMQIMHKFGINLDMIYTDKEDLIVIYSYISTRIRYLMSTMKRLAVCKNSLYLSSQIPKEIIDNIFDSFLNLDSEYHNFYNMIVAFKNNDSSKVEEYFSNLFVFPFLKYNPRYSYVRIVTLIDRHKVDQFFDSFFAKNFSLPRK